MQDKIEKIGSLFEEATKLYRSSKFEEAVAVLDRIISMDPPAKILHSIHFNRSQSMFFIGKYEEALKDIEAAIKVEDTISLYHYHKARIYIKLKQNDMAIAATNKAIELDPKNYTALFLRAELYTSKKQYKMAIKDLETYIDIAPDSEEMQEAKYTLGTLYYAVKEYKKCIDILSSTSIKVAGTFIQLGDAYKSLGNMEEAYKNYLQGYNLSKEADHAYLVGNALMELNRFKEAVPYLKIAYEGDKSNEIYAFFYGLSLFRTGDYEGSLEVFGKAKTEGLISYYAGLSALRLNKVKESQHFFSRALETATSLPLDFYQVYGQNCLALKDVPKALEVYEKGCQKFPESGMMHFHYAECLYLTGKKKESLEHYSKAVELTTEKDKLALYVFSYANALHEQGETQKALGHFSRALELDPENLHYIRTYASVLIKTKNLDKLAEVRLPKPTDETKEVLAELYYLKGVSLFRQKKFQEALQSLEVALESGFDKKSSLTYITACLPKLGEGNDEKKIKYFSMLVEISPDEYVPHYYLGQAYFNTGKVEEAIKHFKRAAELKKGFVPALDYLAVIYHKSKRWEEAAEVYAELTKLNPSDAQNFYNLGYCLLQIGKDLEGALKSFQQSNKIKATVPNYCYIAEIYMKLNKIELGIEAYTKALEIDPTRHELWNLRGVFYKILGKKDLARKDFLKALELSPDNENYKKSLESLDEE